MRSRFLFLLGFFLVSSAYVQAQMITTTAGHGVSAYGGDGGPATAAGFCPHDIKIDAIGNIYFPDRPNARIRKIDASGIITTVTTGVYSPNSIALDNAGNLYIADDDGTIKKLDIYGTMTVAVTGLSNPYGVSIDTFTGNILIADSYNNLVKKVDAAGVVTIIAGNGIVGFSGDSGPATDAQLSWPSHAVADASGNIYICDGSNNRIRKVDASGIITTIAGTGPTSTAPGAYAGSYGGDGGPASAANFNLPFRITFDNYGNLYVSDNGNGCIRKINTSGIVTLVAGNGIPGFNGDGGLATAAQIWEPNGVAFDNNGNFFIADWGNARIRKVTKNLNNTTTSSLELSSVSSGIRAFPNPNNGAFSVDINTPQREMSPVTITGVDGKVIKEFTIQTNSIADIGLDAHIPSGVYLITALTSQGKITKIVSINQ